MKGTVSRPPRPALAAKTATHPKPAPGRHGPTTTDLDTLSEPPVDPSNRITLALLEEFSAAKTKGYDPYNTSAAAHRPHHTWDRKRKRD